MENKTESAGSNMILKGTISWQLTFGDKGLELTYGPQDTPVKLLALLISHEVAQNAKANLNAHYEAIKHDKKMIDRLNWAGKTITGLDIFIQSFMQAVAEETKPPITAQQVTDKLNEQIKKEDQKNE